MRRKSCCSNKMSHLSLQEVKFGWKQSSEIGLDFLCQDHGRSKIHSTYITEWMFS